MWRLHPYYDLDLSTPTILDNRVYFSLPEGESATIDFYGKAPAYAGSFSEILTVNTNEVGAKTVTVTGNVPIPDFCFSETGAMAASPEEKLFDKTFSNYFVNQNKSLKKGNSNYNSVTVGVDTLIINQDTLSLREN